MDITVYADNILQAGDHKCRVAYGHGGIGPKAGEGDGVSPEGAWALREVFYRADRMPQPTTGLPIRALTPMDAWCDVAGDPKYNQLVKLPYPTADEKLWRDDHLYDVIIVIGYNDAPIIDGKGSAIFMHLARENFTPTAGCAAVTMPDMLAILPKLGPGSRLRFSKQALNLG